MSVSEIIIGPIGTNHRIVSFSAMKTRLRDVGLMKQLPNDHPLISRYRETLNLTHGANSDAAKNYVANVARVLGAVDEWLKVHSLQAHHWSELLTAPLEAYTDYLQQ